MIEKRVFQELGVTCALLLTHTYIYDKSVPVTTAWHVLWLRMEEWPLIWRVAASILNKQLRTADKGWSSSLGVGRGVNLVHKISPRQEHQSQTKTDVKHILHKQSTNAHQRNPI